MILAVWIILSVVGVLLAFWFGLRGPAGCAEDVGGMAYAFRRASGVDVADDGETAGVEVARFWCPLSPTQTQLLHCRGLSPAAAWRALDAGTSPVRSPSDLYRDGYRMTEVRILQVGMSDEGPPPDMVDEGECKLGRDAVHRGRS